MKRSILLATVFLFFTSSFATTTVELPRLKLNANEIFIPIGKTGKKISLMELSKISLDNVQNLTGRKMGFFGRLSFRMTQRKLKKSIESDGSIENKKIARLVKMRGGETGFHLGGFALGFFVGAIGVVIAYVIDDDYKKNRIKWAWIGFGISFILNIILIIAIISASDGYY